MAKSQKDLYCTRPDKSDSRGMRAAGKKAASTKPPNNAAKVISARPKKKASKKSLAPSTGAVKISRHSRWQDQGVCQKCKTVLDEKFLFCPQCGQERQPDVEQIRKASSLLTSTPPEGTAAQVSNAPEDSTEYRIINPGRVDDTQPKRRASR